MGTIVPRDPRKGCPGRLGLAPGPPVPAVVSNDRTPLGYEAFVL